MSSDKTSIAFLIDASALTNMFQNDIKEIGKSSELTMRLKELHDKKLPVKAMTPLSNFQRAIWDMDPETPVKHIQKAMSFLKVAPSMGDFKSKEACMKDILFLAKTIEEMQDAKRKA